MGKHVEDIKTALKGYQSLRAEAEKKISFYAENYGEEAGNRERERQEKQLAAARKQVEGTIHASHKEGRELAERWGQPTGSELTDDMKLFDVGMVTPEVFEALKARYKDNATMCAAIKAQGQRLNAVAKKEAQERGEEFYTAMEPYNVRDILTAKDKLESWDKLEKSALEALDMVDGSGNYSDDWGASIGKHMGAEIIEHFGEGSGL